MKSFSSIIFFLFILFLFKSSIITLIEQNLDVSQKECINDDTHEEDTDIAYFIKETPLIVAEYAFITHRIVKEDFSLLSNYNKRVKTPPPKKWSNYPRFLENF